MLNGAHTNGQGVEAYGVKIDRAALVTRGLPLVRRMAYRMARRLPPSVDVGDLIGAGNEGLVRAAAGYDPTAAARFESYAERRIRGAILDELRGWDSVTRHGRRRMHEVTRAVKKLRAELGRAPEEDEIAKELNLELAVYQKLNMELARGPMLGRLGQVDPDAVDSGHQDPSALYSQAELKHRLTKAITLLPDRTQKVLALYYQEDCTQAEIGLVLGVSESRVCQILGEAAARLRALLQREERTSGVARG